MKNHIKPYNNNNKPLVDLNNEIVPLCFFNEICLKQGEKFQYVLNEFESCIVPVTGTIEVQIDGQLFSNIGTRSCLWEGVPNAVYIPVGKKVSIFCISSNVNCFIAGGKYDKILTPYAIRDKDIDIIQYGSDDTKTHRKIKHILGQKNADKRGRLLVSELFTVGTGGWSGFPPHKHDTDRLPKESYYEEVYQFRFQPENGSGAQFLQRENNDFAEVYHIRNRSTFMIDKGYHPCVVMPGYQMYYFTIIVGKTQKSLVQYFQPEHSYQIETIPGIKDMIAKFK